MKALLTKQGKSTAPEPGVRATDRTIPGPAADSAVSTSLMARDNGIKLPVYQMIIYPIAGTDTNTPSYLENADANPLRKAGMECFFDNYMSSAADRHDPRVNLVAADLKGLPSTVIINAQIDPLRSEGEALAERLRAAGVAVEQKTYPGTTHEFFGMAAVVDQAKEAQRIAANGLKAAFNR